MSDNEKNESDITYKFILLGDGQVGKTCIFRKISYDKFSKNNVPTIGIDYKVLDYEIEIEENGKKIKKNSKIKLFDTAGQERFRALSSRYINNSNGIIIVYDITERKSFDNVIVWINNVEKEYGKIDKIKACIFLIGNKNDLVDGEKVEKERKIQKDEAESFAEKNGLIWGGECSAKDFQKSQFDEIFINFVKTIYSKYGYIESNRESFNINKKNVIKGKKSCKC